MSDDSIDIRNYILTSPKYQKFVKEKLGDKDVEDVCGIDETSAYLLKEEGWTQAYTLLGQFLLLKKDEELFISWLTMTAKVNLLHGRIAYECLKEWCDIHL